MANFSEYIPMDAIDKNTSIIDDVEETSLTNHAFVGDNEMALENTRQTHPRIACMIFLDIAEGRYEPT